MKFSANTRMLIYIGTAVAMLISIASGIATADQLSDLLGKLVEVLALAASVLAAAHVTPD